MEGADAKSFKVLNYLYAKDKNKVYAQGQPIDNADASSFEGLEDFYGRDKGYIYNIDDFMTI